MDSVTSTQVFHNNDDVFVIKNPSYVELLGGLISLFIVTIACYICICERYDKFKTVNLIIDYVIYKLFTSAIKWINRILKFFNRVPIEYEEKNFKYITEFCENQSINFPADINAVLRIRDDADEYGLKDMVRQIDSHLHQLQYVKLNVGGKKYELERIKIPADSTLQHLTTSDTKDNDGNIVISRDGSVFQFIQQFLRDGKVDFPKNVSLIKTIGKEAKFYGLTDLLDRVKTEFKNLVFSNAFVKLNVGGKRFYVEKSVVSNNRSSLRNVIESHLSIEVDDNDDVLINQNGDVFNYVYRYLCSEKVTLPTDTSEIHKIKAGAVFYKCQGLINDCEKELMKESNGEQPSNESTWCLHKTTCRNKDCPKRHPQMCKFDPKCTKKTCTFWHPKRNLQGFNKIKKTKETEEKK